MLLIKFIDQLVLFFEEFVYMLVYSLLKVYEYRKEILFLVLFWGFCFSGFIYYLYITN